MKRSAIFITLLTVLFALPTFSQDLKTQSRKYIDAYFAKDQDTYGPMLHASAVWSDPTWSEIDPSNKPQQGKQAFLAHMKQATAGIVKMNYEIQEHFVSADLAIFEGILSYTWKAPGGKEFDFTMREVTVLKFKDGLVIEHTDYANYKKWNEQYRSQAR